MEDREQLADELELQVRRVMHHYREEAQKPSSYSLFYDPHKHESWLIVLYYPDVTALKAAITSGNCYLVHQVLKQELEKSQVAGNCKWLILFEPGPRPELHEEIMRFHDYVISKLNVRREHAGEPMSKICNQCGHSSDNHELRCFMEDATSVPADGWMMCPEEGCTCYSTWSANYQLENGTD